MVLDWTVIHASSLSSLISITCRGVKVREREKSCHDDFCGLGSFFNVALNVTALSAPSGCHNVVIETMNTNSTFAASSNVSVI